MNDTISAYILSNESKNNFNNHKTLSQFDGKPIIENVIQKIKPVFEDITIISNNKENYEYTGIHSHQNTTKDLGTIGGIYTALDISKTDRIFIFADNMPFLSDEFIKYMIQLPDYYDIIIPQIDNHFETLHAIYSQECALYIKNLIDKGKHNIIQFFDKVQVRKVIEDEVYFYTEDPYKMFVSINFQNSLTSPQ